MSSPAPEAAVYVISVAAQLTGLHPQTLRTYERIGLVTPGRTGGGGRRYSARDIEQLRSIAALTASGIGLEGVRRIIELEQRVAALIDHNAELTAELTAARAALAEHARSRRPSDLPTDRLPVLRDSTPAGAIVVWRRSR
ncbi:MAG: heat shock protein transcriptional repressor HspR [Nocardioides sp.]